MREQGKPSVETKHLAKVNGSLCEEQQRKGLLKESLESDTK